MWASQGSNLQFFSPRDNRMTHQPSHPHRADLTFSTLTHSFLVVYCSISMYLCVCFYFCFTVHFKYQSIMVREYAWYDFNLLKFVEASFVSLQMVYRCKCSICAGEECIIWCSGIKGSVNVKYVCLLWNVSFKADISLLIFCVDDLSKSVNEVLGLLLWLCFCQFLPLVLLVVALYILVLPDWVHIYWEVLRLLEVVSPLSLKIVHLWLLLPLLCWNLFCQI